MKKLLFIGLAIFLSAAVQAVEVAGINMPDTIGEKESALALNGTGVRTKFFMDIYAAGLYLDSTSKDSKKIITNDKPMAIRLHITSTLLSAEKMETATREGFEKATDGNTKPIQASIEAFISAFKDDITENDVFELVYTPAKGVDVFKNKELKTNAQGLAFKQALFGIWLSEDPVQDDLKEGMLGL